jgi:SAM-dependent methyltransferase
MTQLWRATSNLLQIDSMPFYWRLSESSSAFPGISQRLPIRVSADQQFDYLKFEPSDEEWSVIDTAYKQNENIGFLNSESGQMETYGNSVNNFFLKIIQQFQPKRIYEIGCGAGYSISFLKKYGFKVVGIDPSEYSRKWSEYLGFQLINDFFREDLLDEKPNLIFCNDVFEHVRDVSKFSRIVYECLDNDGVFCIATTNSTRSISLGDISMFEHQHVNMFTDRSLRLLLRDAGFSEVNIMAGSYGNTFHVVARKSKQTNFDKTDEGIVDCDGFFERASHKIDSFGKFYSSNGQINCYVPLRCLPYLATVGDFGNMPIYDSNRFWRGKFIDGYDSSILSLDDLATSQSECFFVGSLTFYKEILQSLVARGYSPASVNSIEFLS